MSFKTLLVVLNDVQRVASLMKVAGSLANRFDAHLIGLYVMPSVRISPGMGMAIIPDLEQQHRGLQREKAKEVHQQFEAERQRQGFRGEWRAIEIDDYSVADGVLLHGRQADLIIVGQADSGNLPDFDPAFAERIVLEAGRPVLFVPYAGTFNTIAEQVIIGWNGTREAAHAAFDALPFLCQAEETRVIWVNPGSKNGVASDLPGAELAASLARHGAKVTAEAMPTGGLDAGNALLNRASDTGADLLVMGAYGHSRMRELVFGGATRSILNHMTVPVLMSH